MNSENTKYFVEIAMAIAIVIAVIAVYIRSVINRKNADHKGIGIGVRVIQFTCVVIVVPAIVILGLEGILQGETIAAIISGLVGYALAGMIDFENKNKKDD